MSKSKLEAAIARQAAKLDEAQRELVMSQYSTYKWNKSRMTQIEQQLHLMDVRPGAEDMKTQVYIRKALTSERNQLATANNSIASKLFMQLRNTGDDSDEFDDFMEGE